MAPESDGESEGEGGSETTATVRARGEEAGMRSLRVSGLNAVLAGATAVDEVLRETMAAW